MNARKDRQKEQRAQLNRQLEVSKQKIQSKKRARVFMYGFGKFLVDIAKLVFGGVILAGIMDENIDRQLLFTIGGCIVVLCVFMGLYIVSLNKED